MLACLLAPEGAKQLLYSSLTSKMREVESRFSSQGGRRQRKGIQPAALTTWRDTRRPAGKLGPL